MQGRRDFLRQTGGLLLLGGAGLGSVTGVGCGGKSSPGSGLPTPPPLPDVPPAPTPSSPARGQEWTNPKDGSVLVWIPGGTFQMGTNDVEGTNFDGSKPVHSVTLSGFWIGKYEVTIGQFKRYATEVGLADYSYKDVFIREGYEDTYPYGGTWVEAMDYANWAGLTLPTEAQWEYAATGGDGRRYPWGNDWDATRCQNSSERPAPVGSFPTGVSPFGVDDMAGNASEWCRNWTYDYTSSPKTNPTGPEPGNPRIKILRAGSHLSGRSVVHHCAYRAADNVYSGASNWGFRLASRG